jgi:NitT/TauT family transport system permease protein
MTNVLIAKPPLKNWLKLQGTLFKRCALLALILGAWALAAHNTSAYVLPGPIKVGHAWLSLLQTETYWYDLGITFWRVVAGFTLAAIIGSVLGLVLGSNRSLGEFFEPVLAVTNTISSAIWAIFALIWFGISNSTTIFVVFMTAMPLILTNVWRGTQTVNADLVELAHSMRMTRSQVITKIYLPTILPDFFSGARLAFGFGWRVSLVAETIGSSNGVGYRLRQAADLVQTDQVFAWTISLILFMVILEFGVLKPVETRLFRWRRQTQA